MEKIAILGAGTWGTALGKILHRNGHTVALWSALPSEVEILTSTRKHPNLPGMILPDEVSLTTDLKAALKEANIVVFAVASPYVRVTAKKATPFITADMTIVDVAKGLEAGTHLTLTEVIADELSRPDIPLVALSGPTHAEEAAADMPTAIVAASTDENTAAYIQKTFSGDVLRVYTNTDMKGVEISGAMKNIIALAAGISDGLGYGDNTKAAIITRGMAEITRLGTKLGGRRQTFESLAGIGDLIVTCTSRHSSNNRAGYLIGQGMRPQDAVKEVGMVVEGIHALTAAMELSQKHGVELPISSTVNGIVNGTIDVSEALHHLMSRELKTEDE